MNQIVYADGKMPNVIAYARVSDAHKQGDNSSKETQIDSIKRYCDYQKWPYEIFIEEESAGRFKDGKQVSRPILEEIIERLNKGEFQILLVTKTDRLVRDFVMFGEIVKQSDDNKWHIICTDEPIDTRTEMGKMMLGIMVAIAVAERARIKERIIGGCKRNRIAADLEGVPYSVTSYNVSEDLKRTITYLHRRRRFSLREIAMKFNNDGVKRPVEKFQDKPWNEDAVKNLLIHLGILNNTREQQRKVEREKVKTEITNQYQDVKHLLAVGKKRYMEKLASISNENQESADQTP
jgi:site-specific DNA recombinase